MKNEKKQQRKRMSANVRGTLLRVCVILGVCAGLVFAADGDLTTLNATDDRKLQNGTFEEGQTFTCD